MLTRIVLVVFLLPWIAFGVSAQDTLTARILTNLRVREQPSATAPVITTLSPGTRVLVEGRNDSGDWLLVSTEDGAVRGWVAVGFVRLSRPVRIMEDIPPGNLSAASGSTGASPDSSEVTSGPAIHLDGQIMNHVRDIYSRGQANGFNPAMFLLVGDSNLERGAVLCNFGRGTYDLGSYTRFQAIIDYFGANNAFCYDSVAARNSFTTFSVLDPSWAPDVYCAPNETPLDCEIRRSQPAYALIYLGIKDLDLMHFDHTVTFDVYRANLTTIIEELSNHGVIPIVSTFVTADSFYGNDGSSATINNVVREVANAEQTPWIDLRAAAFGYDNHGAQSDGYHMATEPDGITSFNGNQNIYGRTEYEFLVMDILSQLHAALSG